MAWLGTWANRLKLTLDKDLVDSTLTDFPVMVKLSTASGIGDVDVSAVVDELDSASIDAYTKALLHFDGADESTTFTDESGKTWTAQDNAQLDTSVKKFGTASGLFDGTGDYVDSEVSADFGFGTDDFTVDFWMKSGQSSGNYVCDEVRISSTARSAAWIKATYNSLWGGTMYCASKFSSSKSVISGDTLKVSITLTAANS